jgi:hypothetical protein
MLLQTTVVLALAIGAYADLYGLVATIPWGPGISSSTDQSAIYMLQTDPAGRVVGLRVPAP